MAFAAFLTFPCVAQVLGWMLEFEALGAECSYISSRALRNVRVATVAVRGDRLAVSASMFAVVAAKAASPLEVADVVWVHFPPGLHFREEILAVNPLSFADGALDRLGIG